MKRKVIMVFVFAAILVPLILISYHHYHTIRLFKNTVENFENAVTARDRNKIRRYAAVEYREIVDKDTFINGFIPLADKFYDGIRIDHCERVSLNYKENNSCRNAIIGTFYKTAKKDNKPCLFCEIIIIDEGGVWKVAKYSFPDLVDY